MDESAGKTTSVSLKPLISLTLAGVILAVTPLSAEAEGDDFVCGGKVESQVWRLWDDSARTYVAKDELAERLLSQGDTYALYDVQTFTHNLVAMARRCGRVERLEELAQLFGIAYGELVPYSRDRSSVAWICRGGGTCSHRNRLLNREVMLTSVQFLGLVSSIANALANAPKHPQKTFVEKTTVTGIAHLRRWGDGNALALLDKQIATRAQEIRDGSSELFFTDKELWMITIYAELAGVIQQHPALRAKADLNDRRVAAMGGHLTRLMRLFAARTTLKFTVAPSGQEVQVAELDRGFWRLWDEFKFAAYSGSRKPVTCPGPRNQLEAPAPVDDVGWDISHARRLVHALDAIERNGEAMHRVFGIDRTLIPSREVTQAFGRQLVFRIWNGDRNFPLFSNYWNGANGWYRVAYDNGTGACSEGFPPHFLTDAFMTGGYASWARDVPEIRPLARRLYRLSAASEGDELQFMEKYYPKLSVSASPGNRLLAQLMTWPSLIEAAP